MKYNLGNGTAEKALFHLAGFSWIDPEKGWYHFRFRPTLMTSVTSGLLPVNTRNKRGKKLKYWRGFNNRAEAIFITGMDPELSSIGSKAIPVGNVRWKV